MISNLISCGDKVDVKLWSGDSDDNGDEGRHYTSVIYDIPDEENIVVTIPTEKGRLILMPVGTKLNAIVYSKKGVYLCTANIAERFKTGNVFLMRLEIESQLSKYQRRAYFRWECVLDMDYRVLLPGTVVAEVTEGNLDYYMDHCTESELRQGTIIDISGGGLRFRTEEANEDNTLVLLSFLLESATVELQPLIVGRILYCTEMEQGGLYENRLEFQGISDVDREIIIKYIFEEERKTKRRE